MILRFMRIVYMNPFSLIFWDWFIKAHLPAIIPLICKIIITQCLTLSLSPGPYQISYWLPLLSSDLPIPHQDVASKHLWGENACVCLFNACLLRHQTDYNSLKLTLVIIQMLPLLHNVHFSTPEWRRVYFHPPSSCGWPSERRAALRAMESHTECQVFWWKYPECHSNKCFLFL